MTSDATPAGTSGDFPYEELFLFHNKELQDPERVQQFEHLTQTDLRWQTHLASLKHLGLERAAAIQDGLDLEQFDARQATDFCIAAAMTDGSVFRDMSEWDAGKKDAYGWWTRDEWNGHFDSCVFCRRLQRIRHAEVVCRRLGLSANEPLARDWLLKDYYGGALQDVLNRLKMIQLGVKDGEIRWLRSGAESVEQDQLSEPGNLGQLAYSSQASGELTGEPAGFLDSSRSGQVLNFQQKLEGIGTIAIALVIEDGHVKCAASWDRSESDHVPAELNLTIQYQGGAVLALSGEDKILQGESELCAAEFLPESKLKVRVSAGDQERLSFFLDFKKA